MPQRIVYPRPGSANGELCLIIPAPGCGIPIEEIARKDTPAGLPYKIVSTSDVPDDLFFLDAVETDFSEPDGYGVGADAWFAEQAQADAAASAETGTTPQ